MAISISKETRNSDPRIRKVFDRAEYVMDDMFIVRGEKVDISIRSAGHTALTAVIYDNIAGDVLHEQTVNVNSLNEALFAVAGIVDMADSGTISAQEGGAEK